ncbi:MAG: hypothetical protein ACKVX9_03465 [Blastocatellia bacterium]
MKSMVAQAVQLVPGVKVRVKSAAGRAPEVLSFAARSFSGIVWWMRHKLDSLCHFFRGAFMSRGDALKQ